MHWIARVFVSAAVRRVAALLVVAFLAFFGVGSAQAKMFLDQGSAYAACAADAAAHKAKSGKPLAEECRHWPDDRQYVCRGYSYQGGQVVPCNYDDGGPTWYDYPAGTTCASRPDWNGVYNQRLFGQPRPGSVTCNSGCTEVWTPNGDGSYNATYTLDSVCAGPYDDAKCKAENGSDYYYNKHLNACEPEEAGTCDEGQEKDAAGNCTVQKCPAGKKLQADGTCMNEKNECPAGNVKSPSGECLPGDGQCAAGEAKGKDGTCKRDSNGDGVPDSEEGPDDPDKDSASGGDSCNAPPSCNGNPIMCAQLRTQWRIDCNTRKNRNIAGGHCGPGGVPVCTGDKCDAMEYAQLLQTWKASCALEKLAAGEGGGAPGSGDPDVKAIKDALTGAGGAPDIGPEGTPGDSWADGGGGSGGGTGSGEPDTAGYGWGSTCPTPPTIDLMGVSINLDVGPLCSWLALGSYFVLGLAALGSLRIVGGGIA